MRPRFDTSKPFRRAHSRTAWACSQLAAAEPLRGAEAMPRLMRPPVWRGVGNVLGEHSAHLGSSVVYKTLASASARPAHHQRVTGTSAEYGAALSAKALGGIAGGVLIAVLGRRSSPQFLLAYGALLLGSIELLIALYPSVFPVLWPLFCLISAVGIPWAALTTGYTTLQQLWTTDEFRGRLFGLLSTGSAVTLILGAVVASALGEVVGIIPVLALHGAIHIIAGPLVLAWLRAPGAALPAS